MSKMTELYKEASRYYVGGGSAGGRFNSTLGQPVYIRSASGARFTDVDGKEYIDYHTGSGAAFFGHNHPRLRAALEKAMGMGFFMNFETEFHIELASLLNQFIPCAEMVRLSNTGTEVTMAAQRLARAHTGKDLVVRFEGHFHGMHDMIWYNHNGARGAMDDIGVIENIPDSAGIPGIFSETILNVEYNDIAAFERVVERYRGKIAGAMLEPISYNCGCYPARKEFLEKVREICTREGIVLIFDEVISGLRLRPGSAQAYYGVTPDLATFAKAIGGGFSIAALCGKKEVMKTLNPGGKMIMSGTYTGALIPVLAAVECLKMAMEPGFYDHIDALAAALYDGMNGLMKQNGIRGHVRGMGGRFGIYFGVENADDDYNWRKTGDSYRSDMTKSFLVKALDAGIFMHDCGSAAPAHYGFSVQHTLADIAETLKRMDGIFKAMKAEF